MDKLKPCPFCGGEADTYGECDMVRVVCTICGANTSGWWDEPEEAAADWNRRADGWIPVSERLPERTGERVITRVDDKVIICVVNDGWYLWARYGKITHWMPLPAAPETERSDG